MSYENCLHVLAYVILVFVIHLTQTPLKLKYFLFYCDSFDYFDFIFRSLKINDLPNQPPQYTDAARPKLCPRKL